MARIQAPSHGQCAACGQSVHTATYQVGSRYYHERCYAYAHLIGGTGRQYIARSGAVRYIPAESAPTFADATAQLERLAAYMDDSAGLVNVYARDIAAELRAVLAILRDDNGYRE